MRSRLIHAILAGLCLSGAARIRATPLGDPERQPAEVFPELPSWSHSATLKAAAGYKDNLLLSNADEEASAFARAGFEALLWQLPKNGYDTVAFLTADETRYFSRRSVDREAQAYGQVEGRFQSSDQLKLSMIGRGYHLDQVFDVSETEVNRQSARLVVNGLAAGPTIRWTPLAKGWLEVRGFGKREWYRDKSFDNKTGDLTVQLGWQPVPAWEIGLTGNRVWRDYDRRNQYNAFGYPLDETKLAVTETQGEAFNTLSFELRGWKLKATTRLGTLRYRDNGSGYFDYRQNHVAQALALAGGTWEIELEGRYRHRVFDLQTAGLGIDPPLRKKNETSLEVRVSRKLTERWALFGSAACENTRCNEDIASYEVHSYQVGVRWTWE